MRKMLNFIGNKLSQAREWVYENIGPDTLISLLLFVVANILFIIGFGWYTTGMSVLYLFILFVCLSIHFGFDDDRD